MCTMAEVWNALLGSTWDSLPQHLLDEAAALGIDRGSFPDVIAANTGVQQDLVERFSEALAARRPDLKQQKADVIHHLAAQPEADRILLTQRLVVFSIVLRTPGFQQHRGDRTVFVVRFPDKKAYDGLAEAVRRLEVGNLPQGVVCEWQEMQATDADVYKYLHVLAYIDKHEVRVTLGWADLLIAAGS